VLLAGCGGGGSGSSGTAESSGSGAASQTSAGASGAPTSMTDAQQPPDQVVVEISIKGGQVTPTNATLQAKVNEPIVLEVDSDVADELHVHSVPDHEFAVEAKPAQSFQFTVTVPGQVAIELHELDKTVATLQVQQ
jgi:sporulation-control protein spo0M